MTDNNKYQTIAETLIHSDMALAAHLSETRSRKAIILNHAEKFHNFNNKDFDTDANSIFEELNPDAF